MKSKTNKNTNEGEMSGEQTLLQDCHSNNDFLSSCQSEKLSRPKPKVKQNKRKERLSQDRHVEHSPKKYKLESTKKEVDFHSENQTGKEKSEKEISLNVSDNEDSKQDNTPASLKKQKKRKKKKKKGSNLVNVQPNTSTLDYLKKWKNDKSNWKFEKVKQIRLVSNLFDSEKLPDEYFSIFMEYMEGGSKSMKDLISKLAKDVVDEMEKWEIMSDAEKETTPKVTEEKYNRARTLLQMLE